MRQPENERAQSYQVVMSTRAGQDVLSDLVTFADRPDVTEARALGRADVVLRFMMMQEKANEPKSEPPEEETAT